MLRLPEHRPMIPPPEAFEGALAELYAKAIEPNLPQPAEVEYWHRKIVEHCRQPDPLFIVRHITGTERGTIYRTALGHRLKPSDNAPAWWMHFVAFNGIRDLDFAQVPTHMFDIRRHLPTSINDAGWHVAHILNAKDGNTNWPAWSRDELVGRFVRNIHPCNCFYVPKREWHRYGGDPGVIGFFAEVYAQRYASVWTEFLSLLGGVGPVPCLVPRYVYAGVASATTVRAGYVTPPTLSTDVKASYGHTRLCFRADIIEPLAMDDTFEIKTPHGTFRMTKADFYRDFSNVVASASYRDGRVYHSPRPPRKAYKYRVT